MGFFDRLGNLGKGWVSGLGKRTDHTALEKELIEDQLRPTPGDKAAAELAALKAGKVSLPSSSEGSNSSIDSESDGAAEERPTEPRGPVKKTL